MPPYHWNRDESGPACGQNGKLSVWTKPSSFAESAHSNPDTYCKECKALAEKRLAQDLLPMGEG